MIGLKQKISKELLKTLERETRFLSFSLDITVEFTKEHLVHSSKETLNAASSLRLGGRGEDKAHFDYDRWLDRDETERLPFDLLRPYEAEDMTARACNPLVGNPRNNGPEMLNSA